MSKQNFLDKLKKWDNNYTLVTGEMRTYFENEAKKKGYQTLKELFVSKCSTLQHYSQLDVKKIESIILQDLDTPNIKNPFKHFYKMNDEDLSFLFYSLHKTNLMLKYFELNQFDRLRTYNEREALKEKYKAILEDAKIIQMDDKVIEALNQRIQGLNITPTITIHRIFEDLLHSIVFLHDDNRLHPTQKLAEIVNNIIKLYYDNNTRFSKNINMSQFIRYEYTIEIMEPIILYHTK